MSDESRQAADAAISVVNTLQSLSQDDRNRVLQSAAALFGIHLVGLSSAATSHSSSAGAPAHVVPVAASANNKPVSIVEFIHEKQPATNVQRIAVFAYYREHFEGSNRFSRADLLPYFPKAKLVKPGNFDRDFNGAVREGWIHDEGSNCYLTGKGESAVAAGFDGKGKARRPSSKKKPATKAE